MIIISPFERHFTPNSKYNLSSIQMSKSWRSLHIRSGSSRLRFVIPRSLQALPLQNVCLRGQHFSGTSAPTGDWWIHWPIIAPNKCFTSPYWHVCLSYSCTFTAVHHCASLCQAATVNQTVSGSSKVSARFLKNGSKNLTKTIQSYYVCVFLCRERGNGHTEQSWTQCCGYCWTCDHVCPHAVEKKKKGFNSY